MRGMPLGGFGAGGLGLGLADLELPPGAGGSRGSSGGGAKRPLTLAQHQANYAGAHGHYSAGAGRSLLAAQFMSEALRQQLQQYNYLIQSQVTPGGGGRCYAAQGAWAPVREARGFGMCCDSRSFAALPGPLLSPVCMFAKQLSRTLRCASRWDQLLCSPDRR